MATGIYDELISGRTTRELAALDATQVAIRKHLAATEDVSATATALLEEAIDLAFAEVKGKPSDALALTHDLLAVLKRHAPRT
ncbi:MAG TPA: hypothetical protein VGF99_20035, partial [Myxococcota bacterium]